MGATTSTCDTSCDCTTNKPVAFQIGVRVCAALLFVFAIVEVGFGGAAYNYLTNVKLGGWWAALAPLVASVLGIAASNRGVVIAAVILASVGLIISVIASVVDSLASQVLNGLVTCASGPSTPNGNATIYGSPTYASYAQSCYQWNYRENFDCYCINTNLYSSFGSLEWYTCTVYSGPNLQCGKFITDYPMIMRGSAAFDIITTIFEFIFAVVACVALCRRDYEEPPEQKVEIPSVPVSEAPVNYSIVPPSDIPVLATVVAVHQPEGEEAKAAEPTLVAESGPASPSESLPIESTPSAEAPPPAAPEASCGLCGAI